MMASIFALLIDAALATTVLLGLGVILATVARAPLHRQRWAELGVLSALIWCGFAVVPLPRWDPGDRATDALVAPMPTPTPALRPRASQPTVAAAPSPDAVRIATAPALSGTVSDAQQASPRTLSALSPLQPERSRTRRPAPTARSSSFGAWVVIAYLVGAGFMLLYLAIGRLRLHRLVRSCEAAPEWMTSFAQSHCGKRRVRVLLAPRAIRPFCFGLFRATVVLPHSLGVSAQTADAREVLLHEVAHLARRDAIGRTVFLAALPLLFAHPLYWLLHRRARLAAEVLADDWAVARSTKHRYARALVALVATRPGPVPGVSAASMFRSKSEFYWRMKMLLERSGGLRHRSSRLARLAQVTLCFLAVAGTTMLWGVDDAVAQAEEIDRLQRKIAELQHQVEHLQKALEDTKVELNSESADAADRPAVLRKAEELENARRAATANKLREWSWDTTVEVKVRPGDSPMSLLKRFNGDASLLPRFRALNPDRILQVGDTVTVPVRALRRGPTDMVVRAVDSGRGLVTFAPPKGLVLRRGQSMAITRGSRYIGDVVVETVSDSQVGARIIVVRDSGPRRGDHLVLSDSFVSRRDKVAAKPAPKPAAKPARPTAPAPRASTVDVLQLVDRLIEAESKRDTLRLQLERARERAATGTGTSGDMQQFAIGLDHAHRRVKIIRRAIRMQIESTAAALEDAPRSGRAALAGQIELLQSALSSGSKRGGTGR